MSGSLTGNLFVKKTARISVCGRYRYTLTRVWDDDLLPLVWIMLNPSTADALEDDRTIARCCAWAHRLGFGGIVVINLFAWRATKPAEMRKVGPAAIGPENDDVLRDVANRSREHMIIAAWGADGDHLGRAGIVIDLITRELMMPLWALRLTAQGHPGHPLYIPGDVTPIIWKRALNVGSV